MTTRRLLREFFRPVVLASAMILPVVGCGQGHGWNGGRNPSLAGATV